MEGVSRDRHDGPRLSHMQRVAAGGSAMYRTRVFFSDRVRATVATSPLQQDMRDAYAAREP